MDKISITITCEGKVINLYSGDAEIDSVQYILEKTNDTLLAAMEANGIPLLSDSCRVLH